MSLFKYFECVDRDRPPTLPKPTGKSHGLPAASVPAANKQIELEEMAAAGPSNQGTKRRGTYGHYDAELRAKIGKYASENGNAAASRKFSKELGKT